MIHTISYANEKYTKAMAFNGKRLLRFGADTFTGYTPADLDPEFVRANEERLKMPRGAGYWVWKPYIILDALKKANEGDYVCYFDAGLAFVKPIKYLIRAMEKEGTNVMVFTLDRIWVEKDYTKRDAFILMDADKPEYANSGQILSGYILLKKCEESIALMEEWQQLVLDERIVTDQPNVLGQENYPGFVENRHDQTALSLLCKKKGLPLFRDPSEYGLDPKGFDPDVHARSTYPQMLESFRNPQICHFYQLKYRKWYALIDPDRSFIINRGKRIPYYLTHPGFVLGKLKNRGGEESKE